MQRPATLPDLVRKIVQESVSWQDLDGFGLKSVEDLIGGKMLRTRLTQYLGGKDPDWTASIAPYACAAVELIHTASLFHDDVIDGATLRRGRPTLWKRMSPNCAILIGDLLFCESLRIMSTFCSDLLPAFVLKVKEVCTGEAQQELVVRGAKADVETSLRIARAKTGPLFAAAAAGCAGGDRRLTEALEEVGYRIGAAYQLADDLLDEHGDELITGKTLGTDRLRSKFTLIHSMSDGEKVIARHIESLCKSALLILKPWPDRQEGLRAFLNAEFIESTRTAAAA